MRLLIAHDGSEISNHAIEDLKLAGLPPACEAVIMSIAEIPAPAFEIVTAGRGHFENYLPEPEISGASELQVAQSHAAAAANRVRALFPNWIVCTDARVNSVAGSIVSKAYSWQPDLLVVGSKSCGNLGTVGRALLNHASCSLRLARRPNAINGHLPRVLIGIDGSLNSRAVVNSVLSRAWPAKTEIRVVGAIHLAGAQARGRLSDTNALAAVDYAQVRTEICNSVHAACEAFDQAGFLASTIVRDGEPTLRLLSEADQWQADCIIVGAIGEDAHGLGKLGRVAATVAAKANCSVEVVRR